MNTPQPALLVSQIEPHRHRLNIGCGDVVPSGWVNADASPTRAEVTYANLTEGLPWDDASFDYACAHHVLQMVEYLQLVPALAELRRVLKSDGALRLSVPSLLGAVRAHARGDAEWFPDIVGDETTLDGRFCTWLTWYSTAHSVFTPKWLCELCDRAGFSVVSPAQYLHSPLGRRRCSGICDLDGRQHESIYVEALR